MKIQQIGMIKTNLRSKLKFNDINKLVNSINNNKISEALVKQKLDALNEIRKAETKNKCLITGQKILLSLFDDLVEVTFNNKNSNNNNNNNVSVNKDENDNESVNDDDDDY